MKKNLLILFVCLAAVLLILQFRPNGPAFEGKVEKTDTTYALNLTRLNGKDSHTLSMAEGSAMKVHFETTGGSLSLFITAPDGSTFYEGNGKGLTDFVLNVTEGDEYTITVEGKDGQGSLRITAE